MESLERAVKTQIDLVTECLSRALGIPFYEARQKYLREGITFIEQLDNLFSSTENMKKRALLESYYELMGIRTEGPWSVLSIKETIDLLNIHNFPIIISSSLETDVLLAWMLENDLSFSRVFGGEHSEKWHFKEIREFSSGNEVLLFSDSIKDMSGLDVDRVYGVCARAPELLYRAGAFASTEVPPTADLMRTILGIE